MYYRRNSIYKIFSSILPVKRRILFLGSPRNKTLMENDQLVYDALTCDFCMAPLPMTKEREEEIKAKKALEKKAKFKKSLTIILGMGSAVLVIVIATIIYLVSRGTL